jgi:predicted  nucleic acid-binding Zn-ribbon protein
MNKEEQQTQAISFHVSKEDWQRLTSQISNHQFTELVKHDKELQREFHGFRPTHLPWQRVPETVAKHAQNCSFTSTSLIKSWVRNNQELLEQVANEVSIEYIEDGVVHLLATIGIAEKERDRLLWALILDNRPEVQQALANGLHDELIDETSHLITKAKLYAAQQDLEKSRTEIAELRAEKEKLIAQLAQIPTLEATIHDLTSISKQLESSLADERSQHAATSQQLSAAQSEIRLLQAMLTEERNERAILENIFVYIQQESGTFEEQIKQLKEELTQTKAEICLLLNQRQEIRIAESLPRFDAAWSNAVRDIADHLHMLLSEQAAEHPKLTSEEKWCDWQNWQQHESELVHALLCSPPTSLTARDLSNLETVQKLLLLRWYLLEWLKSTLLTILNEKSRALLQATGGQRQ